MHRRSTSQVRAAAGDAPTRRVGSRAVGLSVPVGALALTLLVAGCAGDDGDGDVGADGADVGVVERTSGEVCTDEIGDLSTDVREVQGSLTEPAGIDIVRGEVEPLGEVDAPRDLRVSFELAGDVTEPEDVELRLFQGEVGRLTSWELIISPDGGQATDGDDPTGGGDWSASLLTYAPDRDALAVGQIAALPVPVDVDADADGSTVEIVLPAQLVPPVVSLWVFGASATHEGQTVFDDCDNLGDHLVGDDGELPDTEVPTGDDASTGGQVDAGDDADGS